MPEYYFNTFDEVTSQFLIDKNIKFVFTDVDNTLEPYENAHPGQKVIKWLEDLSKAGIQVAIISNNNGDRIQEFNKDIQLLSFYKAKKPRKLYLKKAMKILGAEKDNSIFLGDQIFTDVLAAHNAGIDAILVNPIKDKTDILTKTKRLFEKPIIKRFRKQTKKQGRKEK